MPQSFNAEYKLQDHCKFTTIYVVCIRHHMPFDALIHTLTVVVCTVVCVYDNM
jgi:hypothetical protein